MNEAQRTLSRALLDDIRAAADPSGAIAQGLIAERLEGPTRLLSVGKASVPMARAVCEREIVRSGLVVAVDGQRWEATPRGVELVTTDHPLPTPRNVAAAARVRAWLSSLDAADRLLLLISGGASSQLCEPAEPLTLDDARDLSEALMRAGATIDQLNTVRKHTDLVKGGRLIGCVACEDTRALVVSDVLGDRFDVVSSGPFVPDPTTCDDARGVLDRYAISGSLRERADAALSESPKPGQARTIPHRLVLNNRLVTERAMRSVQARGFTVTKATFDVGGEASDVGRSLGADLTDQPEGSGVVMGGETVVSGVAPGAKGGPCQEAALSAALELGRTPGLVIAFATDGIDGPTDAAGAVISSPLPDPAPAEEALRTHNAYGYLESMQALVRTGPAGTNANDVLIAIRMAP